MARKSSTTKEQPKQQVGSERQKALDIAMQQIEKQFGRGAIMKLGGQKHLQVEAIPTGSIAVDLALGIGGFPRSRITEIYGPESSGKTTIALSVIAQAQKQGGTAAFIDAEHALDPAWAETLGINLDNLLISQPDNGEQALEIVETLVRSGGLDVIVIDSVAALVPRAEIEGEMGDAMVGVQARLMSQALRKLTGIVSRTRTVCIFTNQLRQKIGVMFGNPETTPGGLAMKFYATIRVDARKIETLKDGDKVLGSRHRITVRKNKVAAPFRVAEFEVFTNEGISKHGGLLDVGLEMEILDRAGAYYKYKDETIGQGRNAAIDYLKENPKVTKEIYDKIWETVRAEEQKGKAPKEFGEDNSGEELPDLPDPEE